MGHLPHDHRQYEFAPIHIETTGDTAFDEITSISLFYNDRYYVWAHSQDDISLSIDDAVPLNVHLFDTETELIQNFANVVGDYIDNSKTVLVGYEAEQWRGGIFRHLRTRCVRTGADWPLKGMYYTDFGEAISGKGRFNTKVPSMNGAKVAPLNDFIDYHDLDIDKSLNRGPKREAVEEAGYTVEQVQEFADETGHEVPYDSLETLDDVYGLFVNNGVLSVIEEETAVNSILNAVSLSEMLENSIKNVARTKELYEIADEFTSRDDWHTKQL